MTDEIQIRQCIDGDLDALEATEPPGAGIARNLLKHQAAGTVVYAAAWRKHQTAGTVVLDLVSEHTPELKHLFVQESARGAGIGTALCAWTEAYAEQSGFDKLYLSVGTENDGARRLYERLGFTPTGRSTTTTYQYVDDDGQKQWATETDDVFEKALIEGSPSRRD
ncbi:GNAT family N-acetyltransferase [Arthrobacter agilis]|uniref:GNAT family N-acetyltransferase n=1 Tax=Arthrobacter agilis TaxID=37921 RepID=UPI002364FCCA|nr:GNAT family N-acetyltransferase [Arthrobacter agilis]WDF31972.1 GNAT family N-acetyltransferase [Arthrobacter agilis]